MTTQPVTTRFNETDCDCAPVTIRIVNDPETPLSHKMGYNLCDGRTTTRQREGTVTTQKHILECGHTTELETIRVKYHPNAPTHEICVGCAQHYIINDHGIYIDDDTTWRWAHGEHDTQHVQCRFPIHDVFADDRYVFREITDWTIRSPIWDGALFDRELVATIKKDGAIWTQSIKNGGM